MPNLFDQLLIYHLYGAIPFFSCANAHSVFYGRDEYFTVTDLPGLCYSGNTVHNFIYVFVMDDDLYLYLWQKLDLKFPAAELFHQPFLSAMAFDTNNCHAWIAHFL